MKRLALAVSLVLMMPFVWAETPKDDSAAKGCPKMNAEGGGKCCRQAKGEGQGQGCGKMQGHGKGQGQMHGRGKGQGMGRGQMHGRGNGQGQGMRGGMGPGPSEHHETIHQLMADHKAIAREIKEVPNGIQTVTTSKDPAVAKKIVEHTYQMKERIESGQPIRMFDPLFQEIFKHHDKIEMKIEEIEGGVRVTETSADPKVAALIRQHAKVVSEFTAEGMSRMHEPSELPEGWRE